MRRIFTSLFVLLQFGTAHAGGSVGDGNRFAMLTYWGEDKVALVDTQGEAGKEEVWSIDVLKTAGCAKPYDIRVNSSGDKAYVSCSGNSLIAVVDIIAQQVQFTFPTGQSPRDLQLFNEGKNLIVANSGSNSVTVYDLGKKDSASLVLEFPVESQPYGVAVVNGGKTALVTGWASGDLHIVDMKLGNGPSDSSAKEKTVTPVGMLPYTVVAPGDGKVAYVAANSIHSVVVVDTDSGKELKKIKVGNNPWSLAAAPDGNSLIVTNNRSVSLT
jgi:YVTN family beta-propeller protein